MEEIEWFFFANLSNIFLQERFRVTAAKPLKSFTTP